MYPPDARETLDMSVIRILEINRIDQRLEIETTDHAIHKVIPTISNPRLCKDSDSSQKVGHRARTQQSKVYLSSFHPHTVWHRQAR
jgi:hypothetical protein